MSKKQEKQTLQKGTFNFQDWKPVFCLRRSNCGTPEFDCKHPTAPLAASLITILLQKQHVSSPLFHDNYDHNHKNMTNTKR